MSDTKNDFVPNLEKLKQLQKQQESIIIGGKGVPRRKKKVVHKTAVTDEKKLQNSLKKLTVNNIQGIEEVNMFKDSGEVLHFVNPKVQASLTSNIFAINGHPETKQLTDMLPGIMNQLGAENVLNLRNLANTLSKVAEETKNQNAAQSATTNDDDDVPELVENFDEASSKPAAAAAEPAAATEETK